MSFRLVPKLVTLNLWTA